MKVLSSLLCVVIILVSSSTVFAADVLPEFKIKMVDKDGIVLQNARVTMHPTENAEDQDYRYYITDANGEFRANKVYPVQYDIAIELPTVDKPVKETIKHSFTATNTKSTPTIKFKLANKNDALYKAEKRTDHYLRNSKNGVVRNMKITLTPTFNVPQPASPEPWAGFTRIAYTDEDGRATFASLGAGEYTVQYLWFGGNTTGGKISVQGSSVTSVALKFDESLLK